MRLPHEWDHADLHWILDEPINLRHEIGFDGRGNHWIEFEGVYVLTAREPYEKGKYQYFVRKFEMHRHWKRWSEWIGLWFWGTYISHVAPEDQKDTEALRRGANDILVEYEAWKKWRNP